MINELKVKLENLKDENERVCNITFELLLLFDIIADLIYCGLVFSGDMV